MADPKHEEYKPIAKGQVDVIGRSEPWNNSEKDWQKILKEIPDFNGDLGKSAIFLFHISKGIKVTSDKFHKKGLVAYRPPSFGVAYGERAKKMSALHVPSDQSDFVLLSAYFLSDLSKLDFDRMGYLSRHDGSNFFYGYLKDFAFLLGSEEAHHSAFDQFKKEPTPDVDASSLPIPEYD